MSLCSKVDACFQLHIAFMVIPFCRMQFHPMVFFLPEGFLYGSVRQYFVWLSLGYCPSVLLFAGTPESLFFHPTSWQLPHQDRFRFFKQSRLFEHNFTCWLWACCNEKSCHFWWGITSFSYPIIQFNAGTSSGFAQVHPPKEKADFTHWKGVAFQTTK